MKIKFFDSNYIKKLLYNKRFTIPFSIILAFVIWMVITINQKPIIDRTFTDITVTLNLETNASTEQSLRVVGDISEQKFTVSLRGPSYLVSSVSSSDLSLYASTASVDSPGQYTLDVALVRDSLTSEFEVLNIFPSKITLDFDYFDQKTIPVNDIKVSAEGITPIDKGLNIGKTTISIPDADALVINGPRSKVGLIDKVVALVDQNKSIPATEVFDARFVLYDAEGNEINQNNIEFSSKNAKVTIPVIKQKKVSVVADFSGLPTGFNKSSIKYSIDYPQVTITGKPDAIDAISVLNLSAIDLSNVTASSKSFDVSAKLPAEGVSLVEDIDHFTVSLNLSGYTEKTISLSTNIKTNGVASGLTASTTPFANNIKICGPKSAVNKINASMITAEVDLTDKKAGQYTVDVIFKINGYNNAWIIGTHKAVVTIK